MTAEEQDHGRLADRLEKESDKLEQRSQDLGQEIEDTRTDWRAKQTDPGVPGAVEPVEDDTNEETSERSEDEGDNETPERSDD
jgi:hypothetical protein